MTPDNAGQPGTQTTGGQASPANASAAPREPKFDVYIVGLAKDVLKAGLPVPDAAEVLIPVAKGVKAPTREDACWHYAENEGKEDALSDDPPKLVAIPQGRYGVPEPKPYKLKPTVVRA